MDGSSGPAQVKLRLWFVMLLATFQVAFAVSGSGGKNRKLGFAAMDSGNCPNAVAQLLKARGEGDSSNTLMLRLSQALECDNRMVDALSATYADNKIDTAGRIDLLLYRAQLLRKIGLGDEADKVEREIGREVAESVAGVGLLMSDSESWAMQTNLSISASWLYQGDSKKSADSIPIIKDTLRIIGGTGRSDSGQITIVNGELVVIGKQVPVSATLGLNLYKGRYLFSVGVPLQVTMNTAFTDWLSASTEIDVLSSVQWNRWFSSDLALSASRTWFVQSRGSDPIHQSEYISSISLRGTWSQLTIGQSNSIKRSTNNDDVFAGYAGNHSVTVSKDLPFDFAISVAPGFAWFVDDSKSSYDSVDIPTTTVVVSGASLGMPNQSGSLQFMDRNGQAIPVSRLQLKQAANGMLSAGFNQWVDISDGYQKPASSSQSNCQWNGSLALSQKISDAIRWSFSLDLYRTEWNSEQTGAFLDYNELWDKRFEQYVQTGSVTNMFIYRDINTGVDYLVPDPKGSVMAPLTYKRIRIDYGSTIRANIRWTPRKQISLTLGWSLTQNQSNLEQIVYGSSYTRTIWNASTSVSW